MPLPAALAARLAKRGIINQPKRTRNSNEQEQVVPTIQEEVIAEDYDESKRDDQVVESIDGFEAPPDDKENQFFGHPGCPNKYNIYHECSAHCREFWGKGKLEPDPEYNRKRLKMLLKYPLPEGWKEVYDPGTGRYYYWLVELDQVSWLPPLHPKAKVSEPASHLREDLFNTRLEEECEDDEDDESEPEGAMDVSSGPDSDDEDEKRRRRAREKRRPDPKERERPERPERLERPERSRGRPKLQKNDLDPMDPASYSEAPRGTWSTGLSQQNEAKTGADTTATGPLYQMRPYPNPGAVLRANAAAKKPDVSD